MPTPSSSVGVATSSAPLAPNNVQPNPSESFNPFDLSTLDPTLPATATTPFQYDTTGDQVSVLQ